MVCVVGRMRDLILQLSKSSIYSTKPGGDTDRYGRLLGTVWLDAKDVNAEQIRKGLAWAYRYHGKPIKPDYAALEDEARRLAIGLWSAPDQTEPWRWRKQHQG
ncbi:thermonuclease family protein [Citrobacter sp. Cf134]|uniref:thermonuclease family protein n=1 Tax=Citrobacter sp. Cf134 TaxID=2985079 RepID=UPI00336A3D84